MKSSELVLLIALSAAAMAVRAEDLGALGPTYPIAEQSAVETIMQRLKEKERTGELRRIQELATQRALTSAKFPRPVDGLVTVTEPSRRLIDPTVTYASAVTTEDGRIVVPAGAKVNPLLVMSLTKRLVFFDGRDRAQVEAVRRMVARAGARVKPILVAGSWYDTSKAWGTQVYFDQSGRLSQRFGIRAVPSVISQQGGLLLLEEVPAKALK
jgi:conjugal transfer pilus assembly protein TraW